jgi:hypothetical protein
METTNDRSEGMLGMMKQEIRKSAAARDDTVDNKVCFKLNKTSEALERGLISAEALRLAIPAARAAQRYTKKLQLEGRAEINKRRDEEEAAVRKVRTWSLLPLCMYFSRS